MGSYVDFFLKIQNYVNFIKQNKLCQNCKVILKLFQSYQVLSSYAKLCKTYQVVPKLSSCVELWNFVEVMSKLRNLIKFMPKLSSYV
jgi:hypothetical protein